MKGHTFTARLCGYAFCKYCGLFAFNNKASRKAAKKPCRGKEHVSD